MFYSVSHANTLTCGFILFNLYSSTGLKYFPQEQTVSSGKKPLLQPLNKPKDIGTPSKCMNQHYIRYFNQDKNIINLKSTQIDVTNCRLHSQT